MADLSPQRFPDPFAAPAVPVNLGQPSAHAPTLPPFQPGWENLLPRAPTVGDAISGAELAMRLGTQRREDQGRNAMAALFANPNNVDANGGLKPEAITWLAASGHPDLAMQARSDQASLAYKQAQTQGAAQRFITEETQRLFGDFEPLVAEYDANVKTYGPERTRQIGQEHYTQLVQQAKSSGLYSPQILQRINPSFDPERLRANILGLKAMQDREDRQNKFDLDTDYGKTTPVRYRIYGDGRMTDITGKSPYTPTGVAETKGAEAQPYMVKTADGKELVARRGPTGGFIDDNTGERIERVVGARKIEGGEKREFSPSKEIAVLDKDGNVVQRIAARESTTGTGWVRSDTGQPIAVPEGGKIDVGASATAILGSRENALLQRSLGAGMQAVSAIKNVVSLPITASAGWFGNRGQPVGIMNGAKETLTNNVTSQEVQAYNALTPGLTRSLAFIDSQGLAPGQRFTEQFNAEMLREGDTQITKMLKLARQKEIVQTGMETLLANPRVAPEQRKAAERVISQMDEAVPWSAADVVQLMNAKPGTTLRDIGAGRTGRDSAQSEPRAPIASPNAPNTVKMSGSKAEQVRRWNEAPAGTRFVFPDGSERMK